MRDLAFVMGFLAMLPFAFGRPHIGALMWCWTAGLVPNSYVFGFATSIRFNLIVVLLTLLIWLLSKEPVRVPMHRTTILLIIFGIFGTISTAFAIGMEGGVWEHWGNFAKIIFFALVVSALFNNRTRIEALIYAVFLSVGFHGVEEGLKLILSGGGHHIFGPEISILTDNNHFALAILCILPLVFYLYRQAQQRVLRLALLGSAGILFFTVVGTFSRGGLIGLLAIAIWAFIHSARKGRYLAFAIPVAIALISFAPDRWTDRMDTISTANQDESFMGRVIAWKQSTLIAFDNPFLGGGFHAVQDFGVWTHYRQTRFHELDFIPTDEPDPLAPHAAHSIYFQVLGDMGFVGLLLFGLLGLSAWRNTVIVAKQVKGRTDLEWAGQLAQYAQYSLIAYFVSGAALSMAYFEFIYILFAVIAALRQLVERTIRETPTVPVPSNAR
ncbi:MAG: putative O-glycosylation ligase, exosortase A system-associated [Gammaproteobacteria bacterium]|nr:putative O-glycosylation ligase, exosortase A system-associated [Gammaproteobacteria bacterium]